MPAPGAGPEQDERDPGQDAGAPEPKSGQNQGSSAESSEFCGGRPKYRGGARKIFNDCGHRYSPKVDFRAISRSDPRETLEILRAAMRKRRWPPQNLRKAGPGQGAGGWFWAGPRPGIRGAELAGPGGARDPGRIRGEAGRGREFEQDPVNFVAADPNIEVVHAKFSTIASIDTVRRPISGRFRGPTLEKRWKFCVQRCEKDDGRHKIFVKQGLGKVPEVGSGPDRGQGSVAPSWRGRGGQGIRAEETGSEAKTSEFCGGRPKYRGGARKIFNDCGH
jgi:hypothetical protein